MQLWDSNPSTSGSAQPLTCSRPVPGQAAVKKVKAMPGEATDGFKRQCTSTGPDGRVYCVTPSWLMIDRLFAPKPIDTAPPPTVVVQ